MQLLWYELLFFFFLPSKCNVESRTKRLNLFVSLQRITIPEIKKHPWFLKNLPIELMDEESWQGIDVNNPSQSVEEVLSIIQEARKPAEVRKADGALMEGSMDLDDIDADEEIETSGDFVCPLERICTNDNK